jgi:hypothetical protein
MARGVDVLNHHLILSKALLRRNCIGLRDLFIHKSLVILMDFGLFKDLGGLFKVVILWGS